MDKSEIKTIMLRVVNRIVNKEYDQLYQEDYAKRMPADIMKSVVSEYGENFTMPSESTFDSMEIYTISESEVSVDCELWYNDERSDLTVIARIKDFDGVLRYAIEDIHIL